MKNVILIFALFISYRVSAGSPYDIANAKIGETFALEVERIFEDGVVGLRLYENKSLEKSKNGKTIEVIYTCNLFRSEKIIVNEIESSQCPDYPRSIVEANKFRVIREIQIPSKENTYAISFYAIEKRKSLNCQFGLELNCQVFTTGAYYGIDEVADENAKNHIQTELESIAAKYISVKPNMIKPRPWP